MKRDLHADLALCEAATPGPWFGQDNGDMWQLFGGLNGSLQLIKAPKCCTDFEEYWPEESDARFIEQAREGWPEALRRAIESEAEVERMRWALNILKWRTSAVSKFEQFNFIAKQGLGEKNSPYLFKEELVDE